MEGCTLSAVAQEKSRETMEAITAVLMTLSRAPEHRQYSTNTEYQYCSLIVLKVEGEWKFTVTIVNGAFFINSSQHCCAVMYNRKLRTPPTC